MNNPGPKDNLFQNNSRVRSVAFNLKDHIWHASLLEAKKKSRRNKENKKKESKKEKFDCHIMHLRYSITFKQKKSRKPNSKNVEKKNCINAIRSSPTRNYFSV